MVRMALVPTGGRVVGTPLGPRTAGAEAIAALTAARARAQERLVQ